MESPRLRAIGELLTACGETIRELLVEMIAHIDAGRLTDDTLDADLRALRPQLVRRAALAEDYRRHGGGAKRGGGSA